MGLLKKRVEYKFCPVCGAKNLIGDAYCMQCGYSFVARHKKGRKGIKWKNLIIIIILLAIAYFGFRFLTGQPLVPTSIPDALNFSSKIG